MKHAIRTQAPNALAILALFAIALVTAGYLLRHQRLRLPIVDAAPLHLQADLPTAQAVTPGQGQSVTVAGVKVGQIAGVKLIDGRARLSLDINPAYRKLIHTDANALLRPRTALKDMFLEVDPGRPSAPVARQNFVIPIANTAADVNQDEILGALDADTRDYLKLLVDGGGVALARRGNDLANVFLRFQPTHRQLAMVSKAVAARGDALRRTITSLADLDRELARQPQALTTLVNASSVALGAFAQESPSLRRSLRTLPGTLVTSRRALAATGTLARTLTPTVRKLRPTAQALNAAQTALRPLARAATPILKNSIRPFVRESRPLLRQVRPSAARSATATPDLTSFVTVVNHFLNTLAYNPHTQGGPWDGNGTEGYLFWIAWGSHAAASLFSTQDAHAIYRQVAVGMACDTIRETVKNEPGAEFLQSLTGVLTSPLGCKNSG